MADTETDILPVYLSFSTFQSAVNNLRAHGLPPKLDRSAWGSRSGAEQGQIISAFKFLGFIDKDGRTQETLRILVDAKENSDQERVLLAEILLSRYSSLFSSLDLKTATPKQVVDAIGNYGTTGATKDRAVRFFLKAAEHSRIDLSTRLTNGMRSRGSSGGNNNNLEDGIPPGTQPPPRGRKRRARVSVLADDAEPEVVTKTGNAMKTIELRGAGGTLTLSGTFNPFELDGDDRALVYDIIDLMKAYDRGSLSDPVAVK